MTWRTRDSCGLTVDFEGKFITVVSGQSPVLMLSFTHVLSSVSNWSGGYGQGSPVSGQNHVVSLDLLAISEPCDIPFRATLHRAAQLHPLSVEHLGPSCVELYGWFGNTLVRQKWPFREGKSTCVQRTAANIDKSNTFVRKGQQRPWETARQQKGSLVQTSISVPTIFPSKGNIHLAAKGHRLPNIRLVKNQYRFIRYALVCCQKLHSLTNEN